MSNDQEYKEAMADYESIKLDPDFDPDVNKSQQIISTEG